MTIAPHPMRQELLDELHSRPTPDLTPGTVVAHLAILPRPDDGPFGDHVAELCRRYGAPPPFQERHHAVDLGTFRLRYEAHNEFTSLTLIRDLDPNETPFARSGVSLLPKDWVGVLEGRVIAAAHLVVLPPGAGPDRVEVASLLQGHRLVGREAGDGFAEVTTALRDDGRGFVRYLVRPLQDRPARLGRFVQRLIELDTYRSMALLALPVARQIGPELSDLETRLARLVAEMEAVDDLAGETGLLAELFALASAAERLKVTHAFRFAASRAYAELVGDRIESLREARGGERESLRAFLLRRFEPAMRTCRAVEERIESLSLRVARTADLARTRVDVALAKQNQALLASMEHRAGLQLRLQETVEGLSVVAVSYYALGLVAYLLKGTLEPFIGAKGVTLATALAVPVVVVLVWFGLKRLKKRLLSDEHGAR